MASTLRDRRSQWFVLSDSPGIAYPAERFGDDWNGWVTPVVTAPTLVILLLTVISDPDSTYVAFAIDAAGICALQDDQGHLDTLEPADDGGPVRQLACSSHICSAARHMSEKGATTADQLVWETCWMSLPWSRTTTWSTAIAADI